MLNSIGAAALMLALALSGSEAFAQAKYPDWSGQWRGSPPNKWDPTKPPGLGQQAPLTPEYQKILEESIAEQALGGTGNDPYSSCMPNGMPRAMTAIFAFEFIIQPNITYILFEASMPRRVHTDGRNWPKELEPAFVGNSIGKWIDTDGDGAYDLLEIETRGFKGPRVYDPSGIPLHSDNQSVIKERMTLDKANANVMRNEITTVDNALTRPWTVTKTYRRLRDFVIASNDCNENNQHVTIGKEIYMLSADGHLMPQKKGQRPPDLRYFK
jgi:hypothetical protein